MPKISIIIPSYNRSAFIVETLNSVIQQTSSDWECLIVDDGSTDNTERIISEFIKEHEHLPIKWMLNQRTKGAQGARNTGILNSTGDYLIFLDSDDILATHCIANRLQTAMQQPDKDYFAFPVRLFKENPGDSDKVWNKMHKKNWKVLDRFLVHDAPWQTLGCLWSRKAILTIGMWDEEVTSLQDWDAHIQAVMHPELSGWLCEDELAFDAYYRVGSYDSIRKKFASPEGAITNVYLVKKAHASLIENDLLNRHTPAFRRFLWIMNTLVSIADNNLGKKLYKELGSVYALKGYKKLMYNFYFANRFNMSQPKAIRGFAAAIPKLFPIEDMPEREDTCMKLNMNDLN